MTLHLIDWNYTDLWKNASEVKKNDGFGRIVNAPNNTLIVPMLCLNEHDNNT